MRYFLVGFVAVGYLAVSDSPARSALPPASDQALRIVWEQGDGLCRFVDQGEDGWAEFDREGKVFLRFREIKRNCDFVDLFDQTRGYNLRLYRNALLIKGGKDGFARFDDFTKFYDGNWVK